MNTSMLLIAAMISGNGRRRSELISFFMRQRTRSLKKWRHIITTLLSLYYVYKGGSLKVKTSAGEVDITDPSLSDSERLRAMAEQAKNNSEDQRWLTLWNKALDLIFYYLEDDSDMQLMQADLWRTMDYADAPSAAEYQSMVQRYDTRFASAPVSTTAPMVATQRGWLPDAAVVDPNTQLGSATNPIVVNSKKGGL